MNLKLEILLDELDLLYRRRTNLDFEVSDLAKRREKLQDKILKLEDEIEKCPNEQTKKQKR